MIKIAPSSLTVDGLSPVLDCCTEVGSLLLFAKMEDCTFSVLPLELGTAYLLRLRLPEVCICFTLSPVELCDIRDCDLVVRRVD